MSIESICDDLQKKADSAGLAVYIDKRDNTWYATVLTLGSYSNFVVRTFEASTLEKLTQRVRFPQRTTDGRAVYL